MYFFNSTQSSGLQNVAHSLYSDFKQQSGMYMDEQKRESIFKSALRTFCKMFFGFGGILIALFLFSSLFSLLSSSNLLDQKTSLSILTDAEGKKESLSASSPVILQIDIHGIIGEPGKLDAENFQNVLTDSRMGTLANDRVKGILLHFNTPGGTVVDSDAIYRMINDYKKQYNIPVFGYAEGLCASGGMYIAATADKMFAGPASTIGSVGVRMGPFLNVYDLMGKIGVQAKTLTEGLDKDMLNPTRPWKEGEDASIQAVMSFMYEQFVDIVTTGRPGVSKSRLVQEYGAQVFDCVKAEKIGYVDVAMSSRNDTLKELVEAAHIKEAYQVVQLSPKHPWLTELTSSQSPLLTGKVEHIFDPIPASVREQACYLYRYE